MKHCCANILLSLICLALMACGGDKKNGNDVAENASTDNIPMLIRDIRKCSKLYTSEYNIRKIVTYSDEPRLKGKLLGHEVDMKMPMGDRKIAIPMNVTLKGYIDFSDFSKKNVRREGRRIVVTLPPPQVAVTASKIDQAGIKEYVSFMRSRFSDAEMTEFEKQGRQAVVNSIPRLDINETTAVNAAKILIPMIVKMGYDEKLITIELKNEDFYKHRVIEAQSNKK
ncbi:MAG: DUF4230 domain-containing protein [Prevotella sp.]|nr:DUF4230 domain-containing protein [Prevotella sp.]